MAPRLAFIVQRHLTPPIGNSLAAVFRPLGIRAFLAHRDPRSGAERRPELKQRLSEVLRLFAVVTRSYIELSGGTRSSGPQ